MVQPPGPLDGVKAVACSTAQAGTVPYVLMADLGAEVIKIEPPGVGDRSRYRLVRNPVICMTSRELTAPILFLFILG